MNEMAVTCLGFLFSLICCCCSVPTSKLTIQPLKPLVEHGGTIQLNCSMDCPGAEVQWEGLDTDLGNIVSDHAKSILTVTNATISMEGTKMCSGQCHGISHLAKVELNVYSFPDTLQLDSQPGRLTAGQPAHLFCSMSHIYPHGALSLSWFQGDRRLEASKGTEEDAMWDLQDQLFVYSSELKLMSVAEDAAYKCRASLQVDQQVFVQERVAIASPKPTQVMTSATSVTTSPASSELPTTTDWKSSFMATTSLLPLLSTEPSTSSPTTSAPLLELLNKHNYSTTMSSSPGSSHLADQQFTTKHVSVSDTTSARVPMEEAKDPCHPMIVPVPPQGTIGGALRITCQMAECSKDVQIQWVETPAAQSQYHLEESEGQLTLLVESVSLEHQGVYRCVATASQPQIASLRLAVSANDWAKGAFSTGSLFTFGTAGSLFGLMVIGYASYRWRKWQR